MTPCSRRGPAAIEPQPRRRRTAMAVVVFAVLVLTGSCGVPLDDSPREIALSSSTTTVPTTTTTSPETVGGERTRIYFVDSDGRLRAEQVTIDPPTVASAVTELLTATSPEGLKSRIPSGTHLIEARTRGERAIVDLSEEMHDIESPLDRVAYAQLTFTVLAVPGFTEVTFEIDGSPVDAPTDDGNRMVVTEDHYDPPLNPR